MKHSEFLSRLQNNEHFISGYFKVISEYKYDKVKVLVETPYGICACDPRNLYEHNSKPTIMTAIDKNLFFSNYIKAHNENYRNGLFEIISDFKGFNKELFVKTKYGVHKISANGIKRNELPGINSAVDKLEFIHNLLMDKNEFYRDGIFKVLTYNSARVGVVDEYGECTMVLSDLVNNCQPTVLSAIDKTKYMLNKFRALEYFDNHDYSKFLYDCARCKSIIICKQHGEFTQTPSKHMSNQGCPKCGSIRTGKYMLENPNGWNYTNWQNAGDRSKNFDSFKVYVIRCWNDEEEFYKIGKTFLKTSERFTKFSMPYNYSIVDEFIFNTSEEASREENRLLKENKEYSYKPRIMFNGFNECFKIIK